MERGPWMQEPEDEEMNEEDEDEEAQLVFSPTA